LKKGNIIDTTLIASFISPDCQDDYLDKGGLPVYSGHYNNNSLATYEKIQLVTTSAVGKPLGTAPSGMRIVKIYSNRIEHEYFGLENLPDSVHFINLPDLR
jgi:hypothetical protein